MIFHYSVGLYIPFFYQTTKQEAFSSAHSQKEGSFPPSGSWEKSDAMTINYCCNSPVEATASGRSLSQASCMICSLCPVLLMFEFSLLFLRKTAWIVSQSAQAVALPRLPPRTATEAAARLNSSDNCKLGWTCYCLPLLVRTHLLRLNCPQSSDSSCECSPETGAGRIGVLEPRSPAALTCSLLWILPGLLQPTAHHHAGTQTQPENTCES